MKTTTARAIRTLAYTAIVLFLFFTSCKDTDTIDYTSDDNSNLQSEANSDAQLEDASDIATLAMLADSGTNDGSKTGESSGTSRNKPNDPRFICAEVTLEFDPNENVPASPGVAAHPVGTITIDFGTGCTAPNGRVRKGKIIIYFNGRRFLPGSYITLTFEGYSIDGIGVSGTRTETNISESTQDSPRFSIVETEMTVTFLDGTSAVRNIDRIRQWNRASNPLDDTWTVTGGATGTTRKGKTYVMTITKALIFSRRCAIDTKAIIPIEGTKELVADGKKLTIDFGAGECDTKVTITVNGKSKEIEVSANGN